MGYIAHFYGENGVYFTKEQSLKAKENKKKYKRKQKQIKKSKQKNRRK